MLRVRTKPAHEKTSDVRQIGVSDSDSFAYFEPGNDKSATFDCYEWLSLVRHIT